MSLISFQRWGEGICASADAAARVVAVGDLLIHKGDRWSRPLFLPRLVELSLINPCLVVAAVGRKPTAVSSPRGSIGSPVPAVRVCLCPSGVRCIGRGVDCALQKLVFTFTSRIYSVSVSHSFLWFIRHKIVFFSVRMGIVACACACHRRDMIKLSELITPRRVCIMCMR